MMAGTHAFGSTLRSQYGFSPSYLPLNHGSYGAAPKAVHAAQAAKSADLESRPDGFIRFDLWPGAAASRKVLAPLLNCPVDDVVLVQNASVAMDTVLRNVVGVSDAGGLGEWQAGDTVVYYEGIYTAVEKALQYMAEARPEVGLRKVELHWPLSDDELVERFEKAILDVNGGQVEVETKSEKPKRNGRARAAVFDTIISMPGVRVPWERLCEVCRKHGVLSVVDGAHGLGHVDIDLAAAKPDFFTSNLHKWLSVPRSLAVLYAAPRAQHLLRSTLPTSLNYAPRPSTLAASAHHPLPPIQETTPFVELFSWAGTVDFTNQLVVEDALRWRRDVLGGEERIRAYQVDLAAKAGSIAADVLGTQVMQADGSCGRNCAFANVRVPVKVQGNADAGREGDAVVESKDVAWVIQFLQKAGVEKHGFYPQLLFYRGAWWWRISAAVYVDEADIKRGAEILRDMCKGIGDGSWLKE